MTLSLIMIRSVTVKAVCTLEFLATTHHVRSNIFFATHNLRNMPGFKPVDHVIFDMDGLLLRTEDIYGEIFEAIVSQYGKSYTEEVREKVMGKKEHDSIAGMIELLNLPLTVEEFHQKQRDLQPTYLPHAQLMPGAEGLVRHLHAEGIPIAVATSSSKESVDLKLTNHKDLFSLFSHIVMGTSDPEVTHGKPRPDIFLVCASRFPDKPPPGKCLVFEDAPNGVKAAVAAGMQVVMVPEELVKEESRKEATLVLRSLEEFQPELFGLPPFKRCACTEA